MTSDSRPPTVCFVPLDGLNPYQRELAAALRLLGFDVTMHQSLRGLARGWRGTAPDLVHLHWLPRVQASVSSAARLLLFLIRLALLRLRGSAVVWTVHNLTPHDSTQRRADRWLARCVSASASRIIVHSPRAEALVADEVGRHGRSKIVVVPHGHYVGCYPNVVSAEDARTRLGIAPGNVALLFFGNIRPYKGVPELVAAFQRLPGSTTSLVIAGKAANAAAVAAVERAAAQHPRIVLRTGFVADAAVQDYMNATDVVVFPYQDVLTSGAVVLAMSFGRACVAPAIGCIPDLLDDRGAFLYDPVDPEGLHGALCRAVASGARLREMGAHNLARVREWGWDRVARETATVYRESAPRRLACA